MEKDEKDLLDRAIPSNPRLKALLVEHTRLDKEVRKYQRYATVSGFAVRRQAELKRKKLKTKDSMLEILNEYRLSP